MENEHLKSLTVFQATTQQQSFSAITSSSDQAPQIRSKTVEAPKVDLDKLAELENNELSELVKLYMTENHALRHENNELQTNVRCIIFLQYFYQFYQINFQNVIARYDFEGPRAGLQGK
jgi:hypothetical protein